MEWCNLIRTCTTSHFKQEGPGDRSFCIGDAINQNIHRKPVSVSKCFCCNSPYVPVASTKPSRVKQEKKTGKSCVLLSLQSTSKRARARKKQTNKNNNKVLSQAVAKVQLEQCCCLCVCFVFFSSPPPSVLFLQIAFKAEEKLIWKHFQQSAPRALHSGMPSNTALHRAAINTHHRPQPGEFMNPGLSCCRPLVFSPSPSRKTFTHNIFV